MMSHPHHPSTHHRLNSNMRFMPGYDVRMDSGNAVRSTVKNMVGNLENVITNLHGIVGDLRVLVHQIDVVTNKIDGKYGVYWEKSGVNHVSSAHDKKTTAKGKDMESFGVCQWQMLREKYDSADYSPDIDWSYLSLSECNNNPRHTTSHSAKKIHSRKLRRVKHLETSVDSSGVSTDCDLDNDDFRLHDGSDVIMCKKHHQHFDIESELKFDCSEFDGHSSDFEVNVNGSSKCVNGAPPPPPVPQHAFCKDVTGDCGKEAYCGMYESLMESKLETLSNCDDASCFSEDLEDDIPSVADDIPSVTSLDFKAEYDRKVNPWTSFGLVHIDSAQESDDVLSESASDILNDNYIESSYINPGFDDLHPVLQQTIC